MPSAKKKMPAQSALKSAAKRILEQYPEMPQSFGTFNLEAVADRIIDREYKNADSQRKVRTFMRHLLKEAGLHAESQVIPPHLRETVRTSTLFSLNWEEILMSLRERGLSAEFEQDPQNIFRTLASELDDLPPDEIITYLQDNRGAQRTVWSAAQFLTFGFEELATKRNWSWLLKIAVHKEMKKVHHEYDCRLVLSPIEHWRRLSELEDEIQDLRAAPQKSMLPEDEDGAVLQREERIAERENAWAERKKACPDITFTAMVKGVEYKPVIVRTDDDEIRRIPGTVLTLRVPGRTVEELNTIRGAIDDFAIRLQQV